MQRVRELDEPVRDDVRAAAGGPGAPTTASASSRPVAELPFAGHPTLGTCHAWLDAAATHDGRRRSCRSAAPASSPSAAPTDGLAFAAPPLIRSGDGRREARSARSRACWASAAPRSSTPQWADNGPGWVAVLLEDADAVLAVRPRLRRARHRRRRPAPARRARGDRGARVLPEGRHARRGPGDGQPQRLAGRLAAAAPAARPRPTSRARAPRSGARGGSTYRRTRDGTIWVGGGTVTCIAGEVEL